MWCDLGESVGSWTLWHFQFSVWLKSSLGEVHFAEKTHLNQASGFKVIAIERFSKQYKTKETHSFF